MGEVKMLDYPEIPGYKIKKRLGQGGMSDVYLGVQQDLSRMVAIKVLNLEVFRNPRLSKRFVKEAKMLSQLVHPNIVTIYNVGKVGPYYFIAMEYLLDSLKERIRREKKIPPEGALHIVRQVGDALFYAHENGIIHRDIKPDNIMFRKDGTPVVLDFGIAKAMGSETRLTKTGMAIGTPQYMSPEQCNADNLDGRTDIYSLGIVFYEMLTGKLPYDADDTLGIVMKQLKAPVPKLPAALKQFQALLDRMMAKEKKKRLRSRARLNEIIKNLLNLSTTKIKLKAKTAAANGKKKGVKKEKIIDSKTRASVAIDTAKDKKKPVKKPADAKKGEKKPKGKFVLLFLLLVLMVILVLQAFRGNTLPDLLEILKKFFKVIGDFLF
jgi:serine/threonine-protein kinase PpkA